MDTAFVPFHCFAADVASGVPVPYRVKAAATVDGSKQATEATLREVVA